MAYVWYGVSSNVFELGDLVVDEGVSENDCSDASIETVVHGVLEGFDGVID